jgi:anti-sigma factor RsiW
MSDMNQHLDEGTIHAWLDGALSPDESARVDAHVQACAGCAALVAEARGLIAASSRILTSLDAVPAGVIPGTDTGTDQLAALRARRAASRAWWRDRRFVAAASLVIVAGLSSVVWQSSVNRSNETQPVAPGVADRTQPVSVPEAAPAPAPVASRDASTRDVKQEAANQPAAPPPSVAASRAADSTAAQKVAANAVAEVREPVTAKVAPQAPAPALDSLRALARADQASNQRQLQQGAAGAAPQRQSFEQQRIDSSRTVTSGSGVANRDRASAATMSVGARILDPASPAGGCYALGFGAPDDSGRLVSSDTIVLLDMPSAERSDPSWFVARPARGTAVGDMRWRQVDSVTVELVTRTTRDSSVVRFQTRQRVLFEGGGQVVVAPLADVTGLRNVKAMWASKVRCP